ncbi:twin-arginine translocation signal domain-containing protein [Nonomuraea wenchangensis]|uniref:twin-arginine translocation signal domain-containing protein n=1 Tax=Nonomuraea wenchangensis TaxID=568860 RepID=UPI00332E8385
MSRSSYDYLSRAQRERERRNALKTIAVLGAAVAVVTAGVVSSLDDGTEEVVADCVIATQQTDGTYRVVDDRFCDGGSHAAYYHWLYGSSTTSRTGYVRGGSRTRPVDAQITTRVGKVVQRGGFGKSGSTGKGGAGG